MKAVCDIFVSGDRRFRGNIDVLGPGRSPDKDKGVFVNLPDGGDDAFCVTFDLAPACAAVRFIANLIDDIFVLFVFLCHFFEERERLLFVRIRIAVAQNVPVDDDVHTELGGGSDTLADGLFQACAVVAAAGTVCSNAIIRVSIVNKNNFLQVFISYRHSTAERAVIFCIHSIMQLFSHQVRATCARRLHTNI